MFISWMLVMPSFKKSLIVEQFQGNYFNVEQLHRKNSVPAISFLQFLVDVTKKSREASVKLILIIQKRVIYNYRQSCHMCDQQ